MHHMLRLVILIAIPQLAFAGGFQISDNSARAIGMGFNVATHGVDASTVFFNPAGMTQLDDGIHLSLGLASIMPGAKFTGLTSQNQFRTTDLEDEVFLIPNLYAVWNDTSMNLAAGLGVFVPYGLGTEWPGDWTGRNLAVRSSLETIVVNPNIAYSLFDDRLSLSAGFVMAFGTVELRQKILSFDPEPQVDMEADDQAFSFNLGLAATPSEGLHIGVSYRHNINMEYEGEGKFTVLDELRPLFQDGAGSTAIDLPFDLRAGLAYQVSDDLLVALGVDYVGWSSYDTLVIHFDKAPGNPSESLDVVNPREYENSFIYQLAAEYGLSDDLLLRGAFYFDAVPVESMYTQPLLPDADRLGFAVGAGFQLSEQMSLDVAYLGIIGLQREVENSPANFNGVYNAWANIAAVSLNYSL